MKSGKPVLAGNCMQVAHTALAWATMGGIPLYVVYVGFEGAPGLSGTGGL
jgi:hypothetical protein